MLFLIRLLSAIAFYICIVMSNQYGAIANTILTMGYRSLLFFSPYLSRIFKNYDVFASLIISVIGVSFLLLCKWYILGVIFIAFGLSTNGFIIKSIASETAAGSGKNKIAITSGNIGAGLILSLVNNNEMFSLIIAIAVLIIAAFIPFNQYQYRQDVPPLTLQAIKENKYPYFIWFCFGLAIGIRVFGLYIVMPNYLINKLGELPSWYGLTLILYGALVILTQYHAISKRFQISLYTSITALALSCLIMSIPSFFGIETLVGALIWVALLALEEIFAPYIDFHAARSNTLLVKELSIGLGGALCVLLTHAFSCVELLGVTSILCLAIGTAVLYYGKARIAS